MAHGPTYIHTKDKCIYCGDCSVKLSDEHIVPLSLGGVHVIRKASCLSCAKITSKFELKVARDLWGDARISFDAPSRRKKNRKEFILMSDAKNLNNKIQVPAREYPAGFVFYKMNLPGLLQGLTEDTDISNLWNLVILDDDQRREEFLKKNTSPLTVSFRNVPQEFGQLLAKIGYGQILTSLDPDDFNPICLPYIMGNKKNVSYIVGGGQENVLPIPGIGYSISTEGLIISDNRLLLIAKIRLYANTHAPEYQVIVGDVIGSENITQVLQKSQLMKKPD